MCHSQGQPKSHQGQIEVRRRWKILSRRSVDLISWIVQQSEFGWQLRPQVCWRERGTEKVVPRKSSFPGGSKRCLKRTTQTAYLQQMSTTAQRRLLQDLKKIKNSKNEGIDAVPDEDNLYMWEALILGPLDTVWEGGTFRLQIQFDEEYPNKPPQLQFTTKMFHPNIYTDGKICIDILQNKWSHMIDIVALLTSIRSLLADPNPESPANQEASRLLVNNKQEYSRRVKEVVELSWKTHLPLS